MVDAEAESQDRTVHVGNVPYYVDEGMLRQLFDLYGRIESMRSGGKPNHMTRYWFIEFAGPREASSALELNGTILGDRELRVSMAQTPRFGSAPCTSASSRMMANLGCSYVNAGSIVGPHNPTILPDQTLPIQLPGYPIMATLFMGDGCYTGPQCFQTMPALMSGGLNAQWGTVRGHGNTSNSNSMRHSREKVSRTVFVEGISRNSTVEDIANFFAVSGTVVGVRVSDTCASSRRAWVEYKEKESAAAALELSKLSFMDSTIVVRPSRTAICTNALSKHVQLEDSRIKQPVGRDYLVVPRPESQKEGPDISLPSQQLQAQKVCLDGDTILSSERSSIGSRKRQILVGETSIKSRKLQHTDQVSWWEKEGKYKK